MEKWKFRYDHVDGAWLKEKPEWLRVQRKIMGVTVKGFVDKSGREIIPCKYLSHSYYFFSGLLKVTDTNNKIGFVDDSGQEVIRCEYDEVGDIQNGYICVCRDNKWGLINLIGEIVIPLKYRFLGHLGKNRLIAQKFDSYRVGSLDYNENICIPFEYYQLGKITQDSLIEYSKGEGLEHGFLDLDGKIVRILPF